MLARLADGFAADELDFTLDPYWIQAGGGDVAEWICHLEGRVPCVHLKYMDVVRGEPVMAPVLEGNMNFGTILKALEAAGTKHIYWWNRTNALKTRLSVWKNHTTT